MSDTTPRSWLDHLFDWVERQRFPVWVFHGGVLVFTLALGLSFESPRPGEVATWLLTTITFVSLAGAHWMRTVSQQAFQRISPLLDEREATQFEERLLYAPRKTSWAILAITGIYVPAYVLLGEDPWGWQEVPVPFLIPGLVNWVIGEATVSVFLAATVRRIAAVGRLHRDLAAIELHRQQPLHAFGAVTVRSALIVLYYLVWIPVQNSGLSGLASEPEFLFSAVAGIPLALAVAIVPLMGAHRLLVEERRRRAMIIGTRIEDTLGRLGAAVDDGDIVALETSQKALAALLAERDLNAKASVWPWAPGTVRTLATTVLLPLTLMIAARVADRYFG